jgi:hypothetical protein
LKESLARIVMAPPLQRPPSAGNIGRRRAVRARSVVSHHAQSRDESKLWRTLTALLTTEGEAAVWMLQPETLNATQGYESVFPSLNAESLASLVHGAFKEPRTKPSHDVLAAVPVNQDLRMVMQQGTFTIHANDTALEEHPGCQSWLRKLLIPAESVHRMRLSLDVLGMRLSDVFPDLGHLATDLAKMHGPKPFPAH